MATRMNKIPVILAAIVSVIFQGILWLWEGRGQKLTKIWSGTIWFYCLLKSLCLTENVTKILENEYWLWKGYRQKLTKIWNDVQLLYCTLCALYSICLSGDVAKIVDCVRWFFNPAKSLYLQGNTSHINLDYLELLADGLSPGGGALRNILVNENNAKDNILLNFKPTIGIETDLKKLNKKIQKLWGKSVEVEILNSWPIVDGSCALKVQISGADVNKEDLATILEHPKFGGVVGSIMDIVYKDKNSAIVEFNNSKVVKKILKKNDTLKFNDGQITLNLKRLEPVKPPSTITEDVDDNKLLFTHLPPMCVDQYQKFKSYIESISQAEIGDKKYFPESKKLWVHFKSRPNYANILVTLCTRPFFGEMISVERVPRSRFMQVKSKKPVDKEIVSLYFSNTHKSGGGPVENVFVIEESNCTFLIEFKEVEDAEIVYRKGEHKLRSTDFHIKPFYDQNILLSDFNWFAKPIVAGLSDDMNVLEQSGLTLNSQLIRSNLNMLRERPITSQHNEILNNDERLNVSSLKRLTESPTPKVAAKNKKSTKKCEIIVNQSPSYSILVHNMRITDNEMKKLKEISKVQKKENTICSKFCQSLPRTKLTRKVEKFIDKKYHIKLYHKNQWENVSIFLRDNRPLILSWICYKLIPMTYKHNGNYLLLLVYKFKNKDETMIPKKIDKIEILEPIFYFCHDSYDHIINTINKNKVELEIKRENGQCILYLKGRGKNLKAVQEEIKTIHQNLKRKIVCVNISCEKIFDNEVIMLGIQQKNKVRIEYTKVSREMMQLDMTAMNSNNIKDALIDFMKSAPLENYKIIVDKLFCGEDCFHFTLNFPLQNNPENPFLHLNEDSGLNDICIQPDENQILTLINRFCDWIHDICPNYKQQFKEFYKGLDDISQCIKKLKSCRPDLFSVESRMKCLSSIYQIVTKCGLKVIEKNDEHLEFKGPSVKVNEMMTKLDTTPTKIDNKTIVRYRYKEYNSSNAVVLYAYNDQDNVDQRQMESTSAAIQVIQRTEKMTNEVLADIVEALNIPSNANIHDDLSYVETCRIKVNTDCGRDEETTVDIKSLANEPKSHKLLYKL